MSEEKQTVAEEPDVQSEETVTEDQGAPEKTESESLDELLAEFQKTEEPSQPEQKEQPEPEAVSVSREEFDALKGELAQNREREDLSKVIPEIRGDMEHFKDGFVETWLRMKAQEDPRVDAAWRDRAKDPKKFARVVGGLGREFAKEHAKLTPYDEKATADREAVAHAVRGQTKPAPEGGDPSFKGMSDAEFRQDVKKRYGFNVPI